MNQSHLRDGRALIGMTSANAPKFHVQCRGLATSYPCQLHPAASTSIDKSVNKMIP